MPQPQGNKLPPFFQKDFSAGMISNVNENITPRNSVRLGMNVDFDNELGSAVVRAGTKQAGNQIEPGNDILGLHDYQDSGVTNSQLLAVCNNADNTFAQVFKSTDSFASPITGWDGETASKKTRFITFLNSVLKVNGDDAPSSYDGSSVITTGGVFDLANIPVTNASLVMEFLDRVYLAGGASNPDRVNFSSTPITGAISWTSTEAGFIDVEPEDGGGGISAFGKVPGYILFFKPRSMKRWDSTSTDPESLVNIGTPSQESVISQAGLCAFFSASSREDTGFYVTNGGRPVPISHLRPKNIQKWVRAIDPDFYEDVNGWGNENHFFWEIGDVIVDGVAYSNVVVRWSVKTGEWAVRAYPTRFTVWSTFFSNGESKAVAGDNDGCIIEIDNPEAFTDFKMVYPEDVATPATAPITWDVRTYQEDFEFNQLKDVSDKLIYNTRDARGAIPYIIANGKDRQELDPIDGDISEANLKKKLSGNFFEFGLHGEADGKRTILKEIEVPNITLLNQYTL